MAVSVAALLALSAVGGRPLGALSFWLAVCLGWPAIADIAEDNRARPSVETHDTGAGDFPTE